MTGFDSITGQKRPIRNLAILLRRNRLPHALLFCGADVVGKKEATLLLAMACNCLKRSVRADSSSPPSETGWEDVNPCGECASCRKIQSGQHPDIFSIGPHRDIIRIAQIRELAETLSMKPYEAKKRFIMIPDAQTMNPEASNAILKLLEEPPDQTVFILMAPQASDLLPTIASRCREIHFYPLARKELQARLIQEENLAPVATEAIAALAGGNYDKALRLCRPARGTDWVRWRQWLLFGSCLERPQELSKSPVGFLMMFAEKLAAEKELLQGALELLKTWLRDLLLYRFCPDRIIHKDLEDTIGRIAPSESVAGLLLKIDIIQRTQQSIRGNANPRLALEAMMLKLAG